MKLSIGQLYTRNEIYSLVGGGSKQSYLPQKKGRILCGCFDPELNRKAPYEIDAGNGKVVLKGAKLLYEGGYSIPVFLKKRSNEWEFVGRFKCTEFSDVLEDLYPVKLRRQNAVAVIYLERVHEQSEEKAAVVLFSQEGNRLLRKHFIRERDPALRDAKKRLFVEQHKTLFCEACGLKQTELPETVGSSCFEVHHLLALGDRGQSQPTRLQDLILVCANCHRMIHANQIMLTLEEIKKLLLAP